MEPDESNAGLTEAIFARDYCVFAPSSCAAEESLAKDSEIRASQTGQLQRWRDAFSMQLARGMRWAGSNMIDWSDALEHRIRVANAESADGFEARQ
jgi:hypothetical protein